MRRISGGSLAWRLFLNSAGRLIRSSTKVSHKSVAIGSNSVTTMPDTVSFGSPGNERRLMNVDDAILGTDAVNLRQMNALAAKLSKGTAATLAMSTELPSLDQGETGVAGGTGYYNGEVGWGVQVAHRLNMKVPVVVSAGMATAGPDSTVGQAGFSFKF